MLDLAFYSLGVDEDEFYSCYLDSQENLNHCENLFKDFGTKLFLIQYQPDDPPSKGIKRLTVFFFEHCDFYLILFNNFSSESGRYNAKLDNQTLPMVLFSNGTGKKIKGKSFFIYRICNIKEIDSKSFENVNLLR